MADAITAAGASPDVSAIGKSRLAESFDTFLALLTTQLKNQDPLSPLDSNQFTQQIVQMTGVEQQLLTNDLLKSIVSNTTSGISTAVSLIGKEVRAATTDARMSEGKAEWVYNLSAQPAVLRLEILDSAGKVVRALAPEDKAKGDHTLTWDGKDQGGNKLPEGVYALRVTAKDDAGGALTTGVFAQGLVTGVEQSNGDTLITVNGTQIPWTHVTRINQPPAIAEGSTDDPDGTTPTPGA